ncbi:hypothetical protein GQ457_01G026530 [Hibiscus cannabinus]
MIVTNYRLFTFPNSPFISIIQHGIRCSGCDSWSLFLSNSLIYVISLLDFLFLCFFSMSSDAIVSDLGDHLATTFVTDGSTDQMFSNKRINFFLDDMN